VAQKIQADYLAQAGIDSISLNPDSVIKIKQIVAKAEKRKTAGKRKHGKR
jgi:hypothetical protein